MSEFRMPSLGADMEQGTLLEWLVHPGDTVHRGDIVAVVDTAKAAVEVECFASGVVEQLLVEPGAKVPVGTPLATIAGEAAPPAAQTPPAAAPEPGVPALSPPPQWFPPLRHLARQYHVDLASVHGTGPSGRVTHADVERAAAPRRRVSPLARRIAAELGVDLGAVTGTGPGGAIAAGDVRHAAAARIAEPAPPKPEPSNRAAAMRAAVAALMARSKREIPHYYLTESVDLGRAVDWLTARNRHLPVPRRLVPAALLLKAVAVAAAKVPDVNGFWVDDRFAPAAAVNLGVAVSLRGGGLVAPAIHAADTLDLDQLMARLRDLVARARAGRLRRTELSDPSLTVSNLGDQGVDSIIGVIYPPQVALVGFGKIADRPVAVAGLIGVRPTVTATLAADHRATDGATGARYLHTIAQLLQTPEDL
ncbi:dihydrolipoamide acetyltransferase family protein [Dactylosporangium sp. CA-052675]|uniref:dihydrolipoamide acetyltransferase family protein n=1 Tax=Dactylosporangium sp. CA-052675 TaxID=3239927 RepID=UPI003D91080B